MPQDKVVLAIFDFDGTLTEGHLWKGIAKHHQAKKSQKNSSVHVYGQSSAVLAGGQDEVISRRPKSSQMGP